MNEPESINASHRDYDRRNPEVALFSHCREWTDIFPWLRLGRLMRLVGSPSLILMVSLTLLVWHQGAAWILQDGFRHRIHADHLDQSVSSNVRVITQLFKFAYQTNPSSMLLFGDRLFSFQWIAAAVWTVVVWLLPALVMIRQGISVTAGRGLESLSVSCRLSYGRSLPAIFSVLITIAGPLTISLVIWMVSLIQAQMPLNSFITWPFALLVVLLSLMGGTLVFSSYFALPLSFAAIVAESHPDSFDAVSRGYESCLRRPLNLLGYLVVTLFLLTTVFLIACGIGWCAEQLIGVAYGNSRQSGQLFLQQASICLSLLPSAFVAIIGWGAVGALYLLLRKDACEQEIEDIWVPAIAKAVAIPELTWSDE